MESVEVTILFRGVIGKGLQIFKDARVLHKQKQTITLAVTPAIILLVTFPVVSTRICSTHLERY